MKNKKNTKKKSDKFTYKKKGGAFWDSWFKTQTLEEKRDICLKKCYDTYEKDKAQKDKAEKDKAEKEAKTTTPPTTTPPVYESTTPETQQPQKIGVGGKKYNKKRTNKYKKNKNTNSF